MKPRFHRSSPKGNLQARGPDPPSTEPEVLNLAPECGQASATKLAPTISRPMSKQDPALIKTETEVKPTSATITISWNQV